jgi:hypothetical protein
MLNVNYVNTCLMKKFLIIVIFIISSITINAQLYSTYNSVKSEFKNIIVKINDKSIEFNTESGTAICYFNNDNRCYKYVIEQKNKSRAQIEKELDNSSDMYFGPNSGVDFWKCAWIDNGYQIVFDVNIVLIPGISKSYFIQYNFYGILKDPTMFLTK